LYLGTSAQIKRPRPVADLVDSGKTFRFVDMTDINGNKIKASSLYGKVVVMNFWFIGCPPCRYEIPALSKLAEDYKDNKDVIFIAISTDKAPEIRDFLNSNTFKYRLVGDGAELSKYYGIETDPLNLVINREGIIIFNSYGYPVASVPDRIRDVLKK
jgi:thiol-disulfide isomerase/thioredoxin